MNHSYRWVIVAAGALMTCVALGAMFSLAIFLEPMSLDTNWSRSAIRTVCARWLSFAGTLWRRASSAAM